MKRILLLSILFLVFAGFADQARSESSTSASLRDSVAREAIKGGYKLITPAELEQLYRKDSSALFFVDTRQEWGYELQHIAGAVNLSVSPTWWYQYSPSARSAMRAVLGPGINKKIVFY